MITFKFCVTLGILLERSVSSCVTLGNLFHLISIPLSVN